MTKTLLNRALPPGVRLLIAAVLLWPSLEVMAQVPGSKLKDGAEVPDIGRHLGAHRGHPLQSQPASCRPTTRSTAGGTTWRWRPGGRGERVADPTSGNACRRACRASWSPAIRSRSCRRRGRSPSSPNGPARCAASSPMAAAIRPPTRSTSPSTGIRSGAGRGRRWWWKPSGIRGDTSFDASPLTHSDQLTVSERIYLKDPNITRGRDHRRLHPWRVHRALEGRAHLPARGGPDARIMEYVCEENNREIFLPGQNQPKP